MRRFIENVGYVVLVLLLSLTIGGLEGVIVYAAYQLWVSR